MQSGFVKADVITPGTSPVDYCFKITNLNQYPEYIFLTLINSPVIDNPDNKILKSGECMDLGGYRVYGEIYAIKRSDINLKNDILDNQGKQSFKDFDSKKEKMISGSEKISPIRDLPSGYQVEKVADVFEIADINDNNFKLNNKSIVYTYKNGESEEKAYIDGQGIPKPSQKHTWLMWFAPILGISLITGVLYWKKSNKSNQGE